MIENLLKSKFALICFILCISLNPIKSQTSSALNFDGTNDYCMRNVFSTQTSSVTIEARISWTGTTTTNQFVFYNGNTGNSGMGMFVQANTNSVVVLYGGLGTISITTLTPSSNILITSVFGNNTFSVYINGTYAHSLNTGVNPITPSGKFTIGSNQAGAENFNGSIDEVRYWDRLLCSSEIAYRANCSITGNEPALAGGYKFNQGIASANNSSVTTLIDASPNANNLTLNNFGLTGATSNWIDPSGTLSASCSSLTPFAATITPVSSPTICTAGDAVGLTASGINSYAWSTGATTASISVSPTITTIYTVSGYNLSGCYAYATQTVVVGSVPTVTVNSGAICAGQSFTMVPGGANTYTYSSGTDVVSPSADASYTVTGTDVNGCQNTAVSSVTVNALPVIISESGDVTVCGDATGTFSLVASNTDTYSWQYSENNGPRTTIVGTYSETGYTTAVMQIPTLESQQWDNWDIECVLTSVEGCTLVSAPKHIIVNALPSLMAMTTNTLLCTGETATLSVSGATTYTWSTAENTTDIVVSPTVQTTYTVNGTDANGCSNSTTITQDVSLCTGITTLSNDASINVYPNPNKGIFVVELTSASKVTVMNALGQVITSEIFEAGKHTVNINNESKGVYFVKVMSNNKQQIIKVIKE